MIPNIYKKGERKILWSWIWYWGHRCTQGETGNKNLLVLPPLPTFIKKIKMKTFPGEKTKKTSKPRKQDWRRRIKKLEPSQKDQLSYCFGVFKRGPLLEDQTFLFGNAQYTTKSSFSFQLSGLWRCNWWLVYRFVDPSSFLLL